jgi:hypothetical protein
MNFVLIVENLHVLGIVLSMNHNVLWYEKLRIKW